jgi:hypothetical protein
MPKKNGEPTAAELKKKEAELKKAEKEAIEAGKNPADEAVEETAKPLPRYNGAQVVEVMEEGFIGRFHRCKMSDGTTADVPIELF